jgi:hypothetical protein
MERARSGFRRPILGALVALTLAAPMVSASSGCAGDYLPSDLVNGLRVLAVSADTPYANPGDTVTLTMTVQDGAVDGPRPLQILWIGGCYNPPGDLYFGCFEQLGKVFANLGGQPPGGGMPPPGGDPPPLGFGPVFQMKVPEDIVSARPPQEGGSKYGIMYAFFAACAGKLDLIELDPSGKAGFFPFACFDPDTGARLGADSFVPGYTAIYSFEDGRVNQNPEVAGMLLDGEPMSEDISLIPEVKACPSTFEERRASGCFAGEPYAGCEEHELDVDVQSDIGELDPGQMVDGKQLYEAVWVDYLYSGGNFTSGGIRLINGVTEGYKPDHKTKWVAPDIPGLYTLSAVVRDTRGGSKVIQRDIRVVE